MENTDNEHLAKLTRKYASRYIDAVILGLNDALVELTGALAGFAIALQNNRLIILAGITTGVAATLSMAASEFLAKEAETRQNNPYLAALCTGVAYLLVTAILLLPFFIFPAPIMALIVSFVLAGLIIVFFTYLSAKIRKTSFLFDCVQMLLISFGVAGLSFLISLMAKSLWDIEI